LYSFFKTLVEHEITVELKNEVQIRGTLKSVDQYLNIKLDNAEAVDELRWPHLVRLYTSFTWAHERGRVYKS
jgi:U6 snRNA-associated Sm-like protein LSm2